MYRIDSIANHRHRRCIVPRVKMLGKTRSCRAYLGKVLSKNINFRTLRI